MERVMADEPATDDPPVGSPGVLPRVRGGRAQDPGVSSPAGVAAREAAADASRGASRPRGSPAKGLWSRLPLRHIILLAVAVVGLYFVWPQLVSLFSQVPELRSISWFWFVLMALLEFGSFACAWGLLRLTINERSWFLIGTAQLAGNAVSRVIPGGAASGGTASYTMFTVSGAPPERILSGLTANTLISTGVLFSLPVLAVPTILFGGLTVSTTLLRALTYGLIIFVVILTAGAVSLFTDRPLQALGVLAQRAHNRLRRHAEPLTDLPQRLIEERDLIRSTLGRRWWEALPYAAGNWLLDYTALLAALAAVGVRPRASLVLLAYVVAALLGMLPITPGGLGFVEVGLAATLGLSGVGAADATLATLAYRLVSFWLPIPAGGVAYVLYLRRYGPKAAAIAKRRSR
jgi:hypothetical protein